MASERLVALQAEIEAKQREVERIIAEEAKKKAMPPLATAIEEVLSAQAAIAESRTLESAAVKAALAIDNFRDPGRRTDYYAATLSASVLPPAAAAFASKGARVEWPIATIEDLLDEAQRERCSDNKPYAENAAAREAIFKTVIASSKAGERLVASKDKMLKALLNQAREDAKTKRENANMFETLFAQMAALQARVTTLEEEKAAKARLAEETIRSLGYSTGY